MAGVESEGSVDFDFLRGGGGEMRYLVVILVYEVSGQRLSRVGVNARLRVIMGRYTVVGRASRSRLDCWSHCCESEKYGILLVIPSVSERGFDRLLCGVQ